MDKLNSNDIAELLNHFSPKSFVVESLPDIRTVKDFTEVLVKNSVGKYDTYKSIKGKWIQTNSNLTNNEEIDKGSSGGSGSAGVDSFNSRTGAVIPVSGDYSKSDVGLSNVTNVAQLPLSYLDTDNTLAADSDSKVASQKATKSYVDNSIAGNLTNIVKQTTETKNSDTTLADDAELVQSLEASSSYSVEIFVGFYFDATPDIKIALAFGGTLTSWLANSVICENDSAASFTNVFNDTTLTTTHTITGGNTNGFLKISGIIEVGASGGNLSVQWAQNTSDAGNTIVYKGSYLRINKL